MKQSLFQRIVFNAQHLMRVSALLAERVVCAVGFGSRLKACGALWTDLGVLCDGRVVCRCNDAAGTVVIGTLEENSLAEIWNGTRMKEVRTSMLKGRMPGLSCIGCSARDCKVSKAVESGMTQTAPSSGPTSLYIESTVNCNLNCYSCRIDEYVANRSRPKMDLDQIVSNIKTIAPTLKRVYFLFAGECFVNPETYVLAHKIKEINPLIEIRTECNGILLDTQEKRSDVIETFSQVTFSIDGVDQPSYEKYRCSGNFKKAYDALRLLVEERDARKGKTPEVIWKYILFNWNDSDEHIEKLFALLEQSRPDRFFFVDTLRPITGFSRKYNCFKPVALAKLRQRATDYNNARAKEREGADA